MVKLYKTNPVTIEAMKFNGDTFEELVEVTNGMAIKKRVRDGLVRCSIMTLEGIMEATEGDYIIKGLAGEFYPCKPSVFHEKYTEIK